MNARISASSFSVIVILAIGSSEIAVTGDLGGADVGGCIRPRTEDGASFVGLGGESRVRSMVSALTAAGDRAET